MRGAALKLLFLGVPGVSQGTSGRPGGDSVNISIAGTHNSSKKRAEEQEKWTSTPLGRLFVLIYAVEPAFLPGGCVDLGARPAGRVAGSDGLLVAVASSPPRRSFP